MRQYLSYHDDSHDDANGAYLRSQDDVSRSLRVAVVGAGPAGAHLADRGLEYTTWESLEEHELTRGQTHEHQRERVKLVARDELVRVARV